jgi:hypothetical protein
MASDISTWVAALLSLGALSFLYRENKFYNLAESIFIGVGTGYAFVLAWSNIKLKGFQQLAGGNFLTIIPLLLGLCLLGKMSPSTACLGRLPAAMLMGMGSAIALRGAIQSELVRQIVATCVPLNSVDNIIIVTGTIATLSYFLFSMKDTGSKASSGLRVLSKYGRYVMMVSFGAAFANATMQRCAQLIDRLRFLFGDWIHLIR